MAPSLDSYAVVHEPRLEPPKAAYDINLPYAQPTAEYNRRVQGNTEFPAYLPTWDKSVHFDEVPFFDFEDPALRARASMPNLFVPGVTSRPVTPRMGTILTGVRLEKLNAAAKDELALLISQRKFVVIREQADFLYSGPQFQVDFMSHFGKLSIQPVSGSVKGFPQFHIIHRDGNGKEVNDFFKHKMTTTLWHHDVSYEKQPPGYVMLGILACPDVGGDTVVADMVEAYKRHSPAFQKMLEGLEAIHSSTKMINHVIAAKGVVRTKAIDTTHPVVRVHPVTGEKALFLNGEFPRDFVGLKDAEAELVTKFVLDQISKGHDLQARVHWEKHSVVMFDGRSTLHTGTVDYDCDYQPRHLFRLAAMAEVPVSVREWEDASGEGFISASTSEYSSE